MVTTTLPTPPIVPHKSLSHATGETNKVRDDTSEEEEQEERQEKRQQPSLSTMLSSRLDLGGSRPSRGSVTITRNEDSPTKDPRLGAAVGDSKNLDNVSRSSNDDDDGRGETLASDDQKVETSKSHSLGKIKVDPAFVVLSPTALEFLQALSWQSTRTIWLRRG
jgi:hypothetical protein